MRHSRLLALLACAVPMWGAWTQSTSLTFDHTKAGTADSTNFVATVYASDPTFKLVAAGGLVQKSDCSDILLFTDAGLTTQAPSYVVRCDTTNGVFIAKAQVATLSHSSNGSIYIAVGNGSPPARTTTGLWPASWVALWMANDSAANKTVVDALGLHNGAEAATNTSSLSTTSVVAPDMYRALAHTHAAGDYVSSASLGLPTTTGSQSEWAFWYQPQQVSSAYVVMSWADSLNCNGNDSLTVQNNSGSLRMFGNCNLGAYTTIQSVTSGTWYYVVLKKQIGGTGPLKAYINGSLIATNTADNTGVPTTAYFGDGYTGAETATFDEMRVANAWSTDSWTTAEYNNMNAPGNVGSPGFWTWGSWPSGLAVATGSLPNGMLTFSYSQTLTAAGGTAPYTWAITVGSIPTSLSLNGSTGAITGTPTVAGTSNFTVQVTDATSATATAPLSITVDARAVACTLGAGTYATLASTANHWTCTPSQAGSYIPGTLGGDAATIPSGVNLTIANAESWSIGQAVATGTAAVTVQSGGSYGMAAGSSLVLLGDFVCGVSTCINASGAGISITVRPASGQRYVFKQSADNLTAEYVLTGTAGSPLTITTDTSLGGLASQITRNSYTGTNPNFTHVRMSNFGDASTAAIDVSAVVTDAAPVFSLADFICTSCGPIEPNGQRNTSTGAGTFLIDQTMFTGSLQCRNIGLIQSLPNSGAAITRSVFDKALNWNAGCANQAAPTQPLAVSDAVVIDQQFPNSVNALSKILWIRHAGDAQALPTGTATPSLIYWFFDHEQDNPHFSAAGAASVALTNTVFDSPGPVTADTGEGIDVGAAGTTTALKNYVVMPDRSGGMTSEAGAATALFAPYYWVVEHGSGVPSDLVQYDENGNTPVRLTSFKSNAVLGAQVLLQSNTPASPTNNFCTASGVCDYNSRYGGLAQQPSCAGNKNAGGYCAQVDYGVGNIGAHDVNKPPYFVDQRRRLATFDSLALRNVASRGEWATATAYAVGDTVQVTSSNYYGSVVNYYCIAAHTSGANTKPESGASWYSDWTWNSLKSLYSAVQAGTTYQDASVPSCTTTACSAIEYLNRWTIAGWVPQNPAFLNYTYAGDTGPANFGPQTMMDVSKHAAATPVVSQ